MSEPAAISFASGKRLSGVRFSWDNQVLNLLRRRS
jgi:hypothetical protein